MSSARAQWWVAAGVAPGGSYTNSRELPPVTPPPPGSRPPITEERRINEADTFTRLSGRATYLFRGPRLDQRLHYLLAAYLYLQGSQSYTFSNDLAYTATYRVTPDTEFGLTLTGQQGRTNDLTLIDRLTAQSVARPSGGESFVSASAGQRFSWGLGPFWSIGQSLGGQIYEPLNDDSETPRTWGGTAGLSINRLWIQNTGTLYGRVGRGHSSAVMTSLGDLPARQVDYAEGGAAWWHSYNDDWSHYLGGGVLSVNVPHRQQPLVDVAVNTILTYLTPTGGTLSAHAERGVHTNVFVGDVLLSTGGGVRGTHYFGNREAWSAELGITYQHSKSLLWVETREPRLDVVSVSSLLTYDWTRHRRWLFELSYTYQDSDEAFRNRRVIGPLRFNHLLAMATLEFVIPEAEDTERRRRIRARGRGGGPSTATIGSDSDARTGTATPMAGVPLTGDRPATGSAATRSDGPMP